MAVDAFRTQGDLSQPMGYDLGTEDGLDFADLFRGSLEFIADRQRGYLPLLEGRTRILDLGCGRGEFLELLREQGIEATGIELDPAWSSVVAHADSMWSRRRRTTISPRSRMHRSR